MKKTIKPSAIKKANYIDTPASIQARPGIIMIDQSGVVITRADMKNMRRGLR